MSRSSEKDAINAAGSRHKRASCKPALRGIILIDVMIAVVIFSIGILGMVALQSSAIKLSSDANYRTNAAMLTDQVISDMWTTDPTTLVASYASPAGSAYKAWAATVDCGSGTASTGCLPTSAASAPSITVTPITGLASNYVVTVKVNWKAPNDTDPHNYVSTTQIGP